MLEKALISTDNLCATVLIVFIFVGPTKNAHKRMADSQMFDQVGSAKAGYMAVIAWNMLVHYAIMSCHSYFGTAKTALQAQETFVRHSNNRTSEYLDFFA